MITKVMRKKSVVFRVLAAAVITLSTIAAQVAWAGTDNACGTLKEVTLYAGQSIVAGTVTAYNDEDNLYVTYVTTGGWVLTETHLAVATFLEGIPQTLKGNPVVGHFKDHAAHASATEYTYVINLEQAGYTPGSCLYIAAHADVELLDQGGNVIQEETAWADGNGFPGQNWATYFTYEMQTCGTEIFVEAGLSILNIPVGTSRNIAFIVNFESVTTNTYHVSFSQSVSPGTGGISLSTDYPPGWSASTSMSWVVNETIKGNAIGSYEITTRATIGETGQSGEVTTRVNVVSGEETPVLNPLGSSPDAVPISTSTEVLFRTILTGTEQQPVEIVLEQVDGSGSPIGAALGQLVDDGSSGDLLAGDYVYSGSFTIASAAEGELLFRAKGTFSGMDPAYTDIYKLGVTRFPIGIQDSDFSKIVVDPETGADMISNEVLVSFVEGTDPDTIEEIVASVNGTVVGTIFGLGVYQLQIPDTGDATGVHNAIDQLTAYPEVEKAGPVGIVSTNAVTPNDSDFDKQWHLTQIRADEAWVIARGKGVIIAVVDTGIDPDHPDLKEKLVKGGNVTCAWWKPWCDPDDIKDNKGHGTWVAGIAAAVTNNGAGIAGVGWESKIMPVKALNIFPFASDTAVANGIKYAADNGAKVINVSFSGTNDFFGVKEEASDYALSVGALVVAPVGNKGSSEREYPPACDSVLGVGATDQSDDRADFSNYGTWVNIAAPGDDIFSTTPTYDVSKFALNYDSESGTSAAAPIVSGAAAVVWSRHPAWTADQVRERLESTAKPLPGLRLGAGRVDLFEAVFNGSFEIGDLSEWTVVYGNANSVTSLGPLTPTHRQRMGYVTTGPSQANTLSILSQTFTIQPGVTTLPIGFDYNFATEDYPERVGSIYNDHLIITVWPPSGAGYELASESVNDSSFTPVGGDFPGGDDSVGMTGWKSATVEIPVTEGPWTFEILIQDAGDTNYDSVVLIDNIRFKKGDGGGLEPAIQKIAGGEYHTALLKSDGTVWTCGVNWNGMLGDGTTISRYTPVQVQGLTDVIFVECGDYHTAAIRADGTLWTWGYNIDGQIGDGTDVDKLTPVQVMTDVVDVAGGDCFTIALKADGTVWSWGWNSYGELGDGTNTDSLVPVQVLIDNVIAIDSDTHTIALKSDGSVWAWGYNYGGALGDGTTTHRNTPVQVVGLTDVIDIAAGCAFSIALKSDGTVWGWGYNGDGEVGDGTTTQRHTPVQAVGVTDVIAVTAGFAYTMALKPDGSVLAWGGGWNGCLGNGSWESSLTPIQPIGLNADVVEIDYGGYHAIALKSDGTVWTWGYNWEGALGDNSGYNTGRNTPKEVPAVNLN